MRAAKRHERKSSDRRFSEKREVGPPGTGNHRCGSLLGECATRKVFFQKESGKPNEGLGDEADTHEERTITASGRRRRSTPPRFPPSQRRLISAARSPSHYPRRPIAPPENWRGRIEFRLKKCYLGPSSRRALKALAASRFPIFHIPTWDVKTPRPTLRTRPAPPPSLSGISPELAVEIERGGGRDGGRPGGA